MKNKIIALTLLAFLTQPALAQSFVDGVFTKPVEINIVEILQELNEEIASLKSLKRGKRSYVIQEYGKERFIDLKYQDLKYLDNQGVNWDTLDKDKYENINWDKINK